MRNQASEDVIRRVLEASNRAPPGVYSPSEDTYLMLDVLQRTELRDKQVLDVGTGSGALGLFCAMYGAHVTVTDSDEAAIEHARNASKLLGVEVECVVSDLFSNLPGRFDLILFNPPYLPSDGYQDRTIDGGPMGRNIISRFLDELPPHFVRGGEALLLVSSLNHPTSLLEARKEFDFLRLARQALFFEELQVLRVRLRDDLSSQRSDR